MTTTETIVEMKGITKFFPGVQALDSVDFECRRGEVHSLAGENGAGKSTLMKILAGVYAPDKGEILLGGRPAQIKSVLDAELLGIRIVFQEGSLIPYLSAMENVFLGRQPLNKLGMIDWQAMERESINVFKRLGFHIEPRRSTSDLSVAEQKIVEIGRALAQNPDMIILDEPTAALSKREVEQFFQIINRVREQGHTVIFISHRIREILQIADRVTVLKDGRTVGTHSISDVTEDRIVEMMIGRELSDIFPPHAAPHASREEIFSIHNLSIAQEVKNVSFTVKAGRILGIGGLEAQGQRTLLRGIFGLEHITRGGIHISQKPVSIHNPRQAKQAGIILVPEDRQTEGLLMLRPVRENIALATLEQRQRAGVVLSRDEETTLQGIVQNLAIKITGLAQAMPSLSGGNLQKVVLAKWLIAHPKVMLLLEPTKGVDVATKSQIYHLLRELAEHGIAVIMYATDMLELIGLCDDLIVMYEGRITRGLSDNEITEEAIMRAAVDTTQACT